MATWTAAAGGSEGVGVWDGRHLGRQQKVLYLWFFQSLGRQEIRERQAFSFGSSWTAWAAAGSEAQCAVAAVRELASGANDVGSS